MTPIGLNTPQAQAMAEAAPIFWCVLIGVGAYEDANLKPLSYPVADCQDLGQVLQDSVPQGYQIRLFSHHCQSELPPSLPTIQESFSKIQSQAKPQDIFLLYFSGHGYLDRESEQAILCLTETDTTQLMKTGLPIQWVMAQLNQCQAGQTLLWLDACHSGGVNWQMLNPTPSLIETLSQHQSQGFYALLSCDRDQQSWEFPELGHGLFTHFLIQGLQGQAANDNGQIEVDALYRYVYHHTLGYIDQVNQNQRFLNQQARYLGQASHQGEYSIQTPKRIVAGSGEFILGQCHTSDMPKSLRKAIVIDGLGDTKPSLEVSKSLQTQGGFEVLHFPLPDMDWSQLTQILRKELQQSHSVDDVLLLYIQGQVADDAIQLREHISWPRSHLSQLLQQSTFRQHIILLDLPGAETLQPWLELGSSSQEGSQWTVATKSVGDAFAESLNQSLQQSSPGLSVAQWLTQLQSIAATHQCKLEAWLSGKPRVIEMLPSQTASHNAPDLSLCPYRGLEAFREVDSPFFYGRDRLITTLIQAVQSHSFVAVLGPSGSGKSSLIHAGVIAQLREGRSLPQSETWYMASLRPGYHPLDALAQWMQVPEGRTILAQGVDAFVVWLRSRPEPRILCVVDQFEELLTQATESERNEFLALMLGAEKFAGDRFSWLITLRSDFLGAAMELPQLAHKLTTHCHLLPAVLTPQIYREIILKPAEQVGLTVEPGLVSVLLAELESVASPIPILAFVLEKLWQTRHQGMLTLEAYQHHVGGLQGALERSASVTYEQLSPKEQDCAQWIFLSLTQINERAEDTRRQVSYEELAIAKYPPELLERTIQRLVAAKLLTIHHPLDQGTVRGEGESLPDDAPLRYELIHEVLIRQWSRLKQWLQTHRTRLQTQRQIEASAREWQKSGQQADFLLRGIRLDAAQELYDSYGKELTDQTQAFIVAGLEQREKEAQQAQRRLRLAQGAIALLTVLGTAATVLGGMAWQQRQVALRNEVETLNGLSEAQRLSNQPLEAIQTALQAAQKAESLPNQALKLQTGLTLHEALNDTQATHQWQAHSQRLSAIAKSPAGDWLVSGSPDGQLMLWSPEGKMLQEFTLEERITDVAVLPSERIVIGTVAGNVYLFDRIQSEIVASYEYGDWINQLAVSADGETLAIGGRSPEIHLLQSQDLKQVSLLQGHQGWVNGLAFHPETSQLASTSEDRTVRLWDRVTQSGRLELETPGISLTFVSDGLYVGDDQGMIHHWNLQTNQHLPYQAHEDRVQRLSLAPDGRSLLSASFDHSLKLWDLENMQMLHHLQGHQAGVLDGVWLQADQVFSASQDQSIWSWSIPVRGLAREGLMASDKTENWVIGGYWDGAIVWFETMPFEIQERRTVVGHEAPITAIAVSAEAGLIASGDTEGIVQMRSLNNGELIHQIDAHQGSIRDIAFNPSGGELLSSANDGRLKLWSVTSESMKSMVLQQAGSPISQIEYHPKGNEFATGNLDGEIKIWSQSGEVLYVLSGHQNGVTQVRYSPNGEYLASGGRDRQVKLWRVKDYSLNGMSALNDEVDSLRFSPDGRFFASTNPIELDIWESSSLQKIASYRQHFTQLHWFDNYYIAGNNKNLLQLIPLELEHLKDQASVQWIK